MNVLHPEMLKIKETMVVGSVLVYKSGICDGHNNAKINRRVKQKYKGVVFDKSTGKWFICVTLQLEKQRFTPYVCIR